MNEPLFELQMQQLQEMKHAFDESPSLPLANHLSAAGREIFMRTGYITFTQAQKLRDIFFAAADSVEDAFPETADSFKPLPEQFSTHLRRRASHLERMIQECRS